MMSGRSADFDLEHELDELHRSSEWETRIARKVLIRYPDLQMTLRVMKTNTRIPDHHNPGRICVHTVRGHIRMHVDGKLFDLPQGRMLVLIGWSLTTWKHWKRAHFCCRSRIRRTHGVNALGWLWSGILFGSPPGGVRDMFQTIPAAQLT